MRRPLSTAMVAALVALVLVTGCSTGKPAHHSAASSSHPQGAAPSTPTAVAAAPARLTLRPADGTHDISPAVPVRAVVAEGKITSAKLASSSGRVFSGKIAADGASWELGQKLGYGYSYTLRVEAKNADGKAVTKTSRFTTVTPGSFTLPYLEDTATASIVAGGTYGVGMVINIQFDELITNKAAAEKAISITSKPAVEGAFFWLNDQTVHWRPARYWTPGTQVSVHANLYGVEVGNGLWGQQDVSTHFKIGASHIAIADARSHKVKVYWNYKLVRTMPTSMGQGGCVPGTHGQRICLWTPPGTYTVMNKQHSVVMDSASYGLPHSSPYGYKETIYWATRISSDGIYLHELMSTVWAQGHVNVSHGCVNLNHVNALWYYRTSYVGDVVTVVHSGGEPLHVWQNGDWSVPWKTWVKGGVNAG
ncbi:MAG TPA: Ig-like domain-containing protein [Jatrophihabitantaceae bacterium]|nr:Ig-like domain-containing protein [Jatrophihabitantaceae bacterium]